MGGGRGQLAAVGQLPEAQRGGAAHARAAPQQLHQSLGLKALWQRGACRGRAGHEGGAVGTCALGEPWSAPAPPQRHHAATQRVITLRCSHPGRRSWRWRWAPGSRRRPGLRAPRPAGSSRRRRRQRRWARQRWGALPPLRQPGVIYQWCGQVAQDGQPVAGGPTTGRDTRSSSGGSLAVASGLLKVLPCCCAAISPGPAQRPPWQAG